MSLEKVPSGWWSQDMSFKQACRYPQQPLGTVTLTESVETLKPSRILTVTSKREDEGETTHCKHEWYSRQTAQLASKTHKLCKTPYLDPTEHDHPDRQLASIGLTPTLHKLHLAT